MSLRMAYVTCLPEATYKGAGNQGAWRQSGAKHHGYASKRKAEMSSGWMTHLLEVKRLAELASWGARVAQPADDLHNDGRIRAHERVNLRTRAPRVRATATYCTNGKHE